MAVEGDDVEIVDTRLTKGNKVPPPADSGSKFGMSTLTDNTRELKAKAYAAEE